MTIEVLPDDVIVYIMKNFLRKSDCSNLRLTCKLLMNVHDLNGFIGKITIDNSTNMLRFLEFYAKHEHNIHKLSVFNFKDCRLWLGGVPSLTEKTNYDERCRG